MKACCDCGHTTTKGYQTRNKWRCDQCHEDWVRRDTRADTYTRHATQDRDRKTKHRSVDT